jgi:hypothetical protein
MFKISVPAVSSESVEVKVPTRKTCRAFVRCIPVFDSRVKLSNHRVPKFPKAPTKTEYYLLQLGPGFTTPAKWPSIPPRHAGKQASGRQSKASPSRRRSNRPACILARRSAIRNAASCVGRVGLSWQDEVLRALAFYFLSLHLSVLIPSLSSQPQPCISPLSSRLPLSRLSVVAERSTTIPGRRLRDKTVRIPARHGTP